MSGGDRLASDELSCAIGFYRLVAEVGRLRAPVAPPAVSAAGGAGSDVAAKAKANKAGESADTPVTQAGNPKKHAEQAKVHGSGKGGAAATAAVPKAAAAAPPAKPKYVPPPVQEAPRQRRPALAGPKLPKPSEDNILITSALPYVNNVPHLGNIIGCVLSADVFARYCRQRGRNAVYICGTDEYGTATEAKAQEEGLTPRAVCDKYHAEHKAIYEWFDISFDFFGRTSTPDPWKDAGWPQTDICQDIFRGNVERGNTFEATVEQMYCTDCAKFLADRFIEGECPLCHYDDARGDQCDKCGQLLSATDLLQPRCKVGKEAGHKVEVRTSRHVFLDLPKLTGELEAWVSQSSKVGDWTANAVQITNSWIREGLKPRGITRDLKWGTPVPHPGFQDKVFYVWFDAPIGYISMTANYTAEWRQWWHARHESDKRVKLYQFMGKDNVPFHTVIFPASLIGSGKPWTLLHHVSTTEYLNYEAGKFSKSRGVGVFGDSARDTGIPSEVWRYYLLANRPEVSDSIFTWPDFAEKTNNELLKNLGNFVNRALNFAWANFEGKVASVGEAGLSARDKELVAAVNVLLGEYNGHMTAVRLKHGLRTMMEVSTLANGYMQDCKPWELTKSDPARAATVIGVAVGMVRLLAALAEPFMPGFTDKVVHVLGLPHMDIPDTFAPGAAVPPGTVLTGKPLPLFSAISEEQVAHFRERFGGSQAEQADRAAAEAAAAAGGGAGAAATPAGGDKKGKGGGAGGKGAAAEPAEAANEEDPVSCCKFLVGTIVDCWKHPESDKLWCEKIEVGEAQPREIASGLQQVFTLEQMKGQRVVVIANLQARKLAGFPSNGMVLCATGPDGKVEFVEPPAGAKDGERVVFPGHEGGAVEPNRMAKKKLWEAVAPDLHVDGAKVATWKGVPFTTSAGPCTVKSVPAGSLIK